MASYHLPGQQDDGLHVWRPQQGLEFDPDQNGAKRSGHHDKQPVPSYHHSDDFHDDGEIGKTHQEKTSRNPFGLSPLLFGLIVALVTAIIIGGAVGGGVGSQIKPSSDQSQSASATTTVTVTKTASSSSTSSTISSTTYYTDYIAPLPAQVLSVPYDCPSLNTLTITTAQNDEFSFVCGVDYVGNDIAALIAYRIEDCCGACSAMNAQLGTKNCQAFTFNANMSYAYANNTPRGGNNCWLKSQTDSGNQNSGNGQLLVGGRLN